MDETEPLDFSMAEKPEEITESALGDMDFKKKRAFIEKAKLDLSTIRTTHDVVQAFEHEHRSLIENSYRRMFDRRRDFLSEWEQFNRHAKSPILSGLKASADESFNGGTEAYFYSLQVLVYLSIYSDRLAATMMGILNTQTGLSPEIKKQFVDDAKNLIRLAERFDGMAKTMREG